MAGKRGNGEGTIYRRKDGRYEGQTYALTVGGNRKRVSVYGKTRQEVQEKLTSANMQTQQGIPVPDRAWKLGEYLDYWLEHAVRVKRRPLTYERHEAIVRLYLKPGIGHRILHRLTVQMVQAYFDQLHADGYSNSQLDHVRKVLSAALTYAMRQELVMRNVARLVELPTYTPTETDHWTPEEATQFLQAARPDPLYPAFVLIVLYGLRRGEALGLRWADVDFDQGVIHIRQQLQSIEGALQQVPLKTKTSKRDEPLLATARVVLQEQWARQTTARTMAGVGWQGSDVGEGLVFTTRNGRPIDPRNLGRSFQRICEEHGIRHITVHGMRHTNATAQKNLQVHPRDIQAILGHSDMRVTGIYEHVDLDSKRGALQKVEQQFFRPTATANRGGYRQLVPSSGKTVDPITSLISGSRGGIRTRDPRLMSRGGTTVEHRLLSVRETMEARKRDWLVGCVAVNFAVMIEQLVTDIPAAGSMASKGNPSSPEAVLGRLGTRGVGVRDAVLGTVAVGVQVARDVRAIRARHSM